MVMLRLRGHRCNIVPLVSHQHLGARELPFSAMFRHVWAMFGYVWLCLAVFGCVWLCWAMFGLCLVLFGYVRPCLATVPCALLCLLTVRGGLYLQQNR